MSEDVVELRRLSVSAETNKGTDTITKQIYRIEVADVSYEIPTFCLVKTIRALSLVAELAESVGAAQVVGAATESAQNGEFSQPTAPGFLVRLLSVLPAALLNSQPAVYKLLGLIVTKNREFAVWDEEEADVDAELYRRGKGIGLSATNDEVIQLVMVGVKAMGVETIITQLPNLMRLLTGGKS